MFPNLAALNASGASRADLVAILLTGIPPGIIPGFQNLSANLRNRYADLLRLNVAIPPSANPNKLGILGGDLAGFPNGRRLADDIVAIELKAIAGATYPLVAPTLHARRRGRPAHAAAVQPGLARRRPVPADVPVRRDSARRLQHAVAVVDPLTPRRSGGTPPPPERRRRNGGADARARPPPRPRPRPRPHTHDHTAGAPPARGGRRARDRRRARRARRLHRPRRCCTRRSRSAPRATTTTAATRTCSSASSAGARSTPPSSTRSPAGAYTLWHDDVALTRGATRRGRRDRRARLDDRRRQRPERAGARNPGRRRQLERRALRHEVLAADRRVVRVGHGAEVDRRRGRWRTGRRRRRRAGGRAARTRRRSGARGSAVSCPFLQGEWCESWFVLSACDGDRTRLPIGPVRPPTRSAWLAWARAPARRARRPRSGTRRLGGRRGSVAAPDARRPPAIGRPARRDRRGAALGPRRLGRAPARGAGRADATRARAQYLGPLAARPGGGTHVADRLGRRVPPVRRARRRRAARRRRRAAPRRRQRRSSRAAPAGRR